MTDYDEVWRMVNFVLAASAWILLSLRALRLWSAWTPRLRLLAQALMLFLFTTAWGSVENIVQGNPAGSRTFLATVSCLWVLSSLLFTREGYTKDGRPPGSAS